MTAPLPAAIAGLWALLVLGAAWTARPPRRRRPGWPRPWVVGRLPAAARAGLDSASVTLGGFALRLAGLHRPALALPVGRALLATAVLTPLASPVVGVGAGVLAWWLPAFVRRRQSRRRTERIDAAVAELAELMLVVVRAGAGPRRALQVAARWAPPALRSPLDEALRGLAAGQRLDEALASLGQHSPALGLLAATITGSVTAGSPVATALSDLAAEGRRMRRHQAQAAARRLPVLLLFPLTVCILPAFGLLTVGPALATGVRALAP